MKLSKQYLKSLRLVSAKGTLNIDGRPDVTRYRNLEKLGLVQGTGLRVVRLTKAGKKALATGETEEPEPVTSAVVAATIASYIGFVGFVEETEYGF